MSSVETVLAVYAEIFCCCCRLKHL